MDWSRRTVLTGLGVLPLLSGCGQRRGDAIEMWAMGAEAENLPTLLASIAGAPEVMIQPLPWSAAHEKLLTSYAGDSLPDLGQIGNSWIAELTAIDAIEPVPANVEPLIADFFPAVVETNRINGQLMGLPWYVDTRLQFYRTDMFARAGYSAPPLIWDEWKLALHRVKQVAGPDSYAILLPVNEHEHLTQMALSAGATLLNEAGTRGAFSAPEFRRALAFYKSIYDEGLAPVASSTQISNVWNEFARGYFSVYPSGPWTIGDMKSRLPPDMQGKWATAPFPGPNGPGSAAPGGSSLVVYKGARDPAAAWALAASLITAPAQAKLQKLTGDLPPSREVWDATGLLQNPITRAFAVQLDRARALPKVPEWERIVTEMQTVAERVVRGRTSIDQAVQEIDRRADLLLEKRRWMLERRA